MNIALMAHDGRKELMIQFCIAYYGIFVKHTLCATNTTGRLVSEATGLPIELLMSCNQGGGKQICSRIEYNEIDLVLFFCDPELVDDYHKNVMDIVSQCDRKNVPFASNVATAEVLIRGLERGDMQWRDIINSR